MKMCELLADPSKWTKGVTARDAEGNSVASGSEFATCFCLIGAILKCYPPGPLTITGVNAYKLIQDKVGTGDLIDWNDAPERTHEEVLNVLKELDI